MRDDNHDVICIWLVQDVYSMIGKIIPLAIQNAVVSLQAAHPFRPSLVQG